MHVLCPTDGCFNFYKCSWIELLVLTHTCSPCFIVPYPCGRLARSIAESLNTRSIISAEDGNQIHSVNYVNTTEFNKTETSPTDTPAVYNTTTPIYNTTSPHATLENIPSWAFYPTLPTITNKPNEEHRIVGGLEAKPGEIPWQVRHLANAFIESDIQEMTLVHLRQCNTAVWWPTFFKIPLQCTNSFDSCLFYVSVMLAGCFDGKGE